MNMMLHLDSSLIWWQLARLKLGENFDNQMLQVIQDANI